MYLKTCNAEFGTADVETISAEVCVLYSVHSSGSETNPSEEVADFNAQKAGLYSKYVLNLLAMKDKVHTQPTRKCTA